MTDLLFISDSPNGAWHVGDTAFDPSERAQLSGREFAVVLPGQSVRILPHDLPRLRTRERLSAARFHVEPLVAEDVDSLHIAVAEGRLGVVSRARMDRLMDALSTAGVTPTAIVADFDILGPSTLPDRIVVEGATLDPGFPLDGEVPSPMGFADAARRARLEGAVDFLTGTYARRAIPAFSELGSLLGRWRWAAALPVLLVASWGLQQAAQARAERLQVADLRERAATLYTDATGETASDPARAVRALTATPAGPSALDALAVLYAAMEDVPDVSVSRLRWDEGRAQLEVEFLYPGFEATSSVEAAVARAGGQLEAGGIRELQDRLVGDAVLTLAREG